MNARGVACVRTGNVPVSVERGLGTDLATHGWPLSTRQFLVVPVAGCEELAAVDIPGPGSLWPGSWGLVHPASVPAAIDSI